MKWLQAIRDMDKGKCRIGHYGIKHRIVEDQLQYYTGMEWVNTELSEEDQEHEWTIPEPTYREISWKEAVDTDWRKVEYKVKYGVWVPTTDDFSGNSVQFMKETEFRVREDDE